MIKIFNSSLLNSIKYIEMAGPFATFFLRGTYKYPKAFLSVEFYELERGIFILWEGVCLPDSENCLELKNESNVIADLNPISGYTLGATLTDSVSKDDILCGKINLVCIDEEIAYGKA